MLQCFVVATTCTCSITIHRGINTPNASVSAVVSTLMLNPLLGSLLTEDTYSDRVRCLSQQ